MSSHGDVLEKLGEVRSSHIVQEIFLLGFIVILNMKHVIESPIGDLRVLSGDTLTVLGGILSLNCTRKCVLIELGYVVTSH